MATSTKGSDLSVVRIAPRKIPTKCRTVQVKYVEQYSDSPRGLVSHHTGLLENSDYVRTRVVLSYVCRKH